MENMGKLLHRCEVDLDAGALERLWTYHGLLRRHNQDRDLTRITGFEPMVVKHYADCLWVAKLTSLPSPLLDIGTGAGFPGIPLKIAHPNLSITLAEPRPKRVEFLHTCIETLGLRDCTVFDHKVVSQSFKTPVAGIITRALETMDKTFLRTSGCVQVGTKIVFMKGPNAQDEIREVQRRFGSWVSLVQDEEYVLPHTPYERRLVVWNIDRLPQDLTVPPHEVEAQSVE